MFEGFTNHLITVGDVRIHAVSGGIGPALLLLHGYPQTHVMWHKVAPRLAEQFTVVAMDLRGYGDSDKPPGAEDHGNYSKRTMALDAVGLMDALGHRRFAVVGHDRGGRVAHRLALDHPQAVTRAAVLDIAPTATMYGRTDMAFARAYFHWFLLIQPAGFPEHFIGLDPEYFLRSLLKSWSRREGIDAEALAEYLRCFARPETIHATCEDYRAAATIDLAHDREDAESKIRCPLLALWGADGVVGRMYDVLATWKEKATDVTGLALPCGHFLPEEAPDETLAALRSFLGALPDCR